MFTFPIRVYWEDTDAGGIVFYANHLKYMERARTEWLRSLGISQQALKNQTGGMFVVTDTQLKYLLPARLDDELLVSAEILEKGRASLKILQKIALIRPLINNSLLLNNEQMNSSDLLASDISSSGDLICQGTICIAWVNSATLKAGRIPTQLLEAIT
jgi:acyl-CoA thioester hydrolase